VLRPSSSAAGSRRTRPRSSDLNGNPLNEEARDRRSGGTRRGVEAGGLQVVIGRATVTCAGLVSKSTLGGRDRVGRLALRCSR